MELRYHVNDDCSLGQVTFEGLCGNEYVTSTKGALNVLKVTNPKSVFAREVKSGAYDAIANEEFDKMLDTVKYISKLWRYPDDPDDDTSRPEMNVLTLLANAIELLGRQHAELQKVERLYR